MPNFLQQKRPLILASGSLIRQKLLLSLGLEFLVIPSHCDEDLIKKEHNSTDFLSLGLKLAQQKALEVSLKYPEYIIIAADQLCVIDNILLDKPLDHQTAVNHLRTLCGKTHQQIACLCIAHNQQIVWQHHDIAELTVHDLSEDTIERYLQEERPYHSCGAYHYESSGKWLFKEIKGTEDTILGLPLRPLMNALINLKAIAI